MNKKPYFYTLVTRSTSFCLRNESLQVQNAISWYQDETSLYCHDFTIPTVCSSVQLKINQAIGFLVCFYVHTTLLIAHGKFQPAIGQYIMCFEFSPERLRRANLPELLTHGHSGAVAHQVKPGENVSTQLSGSLLFGNVAWEFCGMVEELTGQYSCLDWSLLHRISLWEFGVVHHSHTRNAPGCTRRTWRYQAHSTGPHPKPKSLPVLQKCSQTWEFSAVSSEASPSLCPY